MPQKISMRDSDTFKIDAQLRKRRRFRLTKACYPCRRRKVKCDLSEPCGSCSVRGHPDLCDYTIQPLTCNEAMNHAQDLGVRSIDSQCSHNIWANCERGQGLYIDPMPPYNSKLHVGPDSLPHLLSIYQSLNTRQEEQQGPRSVSFNRRTNPQTIFELLCLQDSSSGFPFTNLWGPEDGPEKVLSALPEDETLLRYAGPRHRF